MYDDKQIMTEYSRWRAQKLPDPALEKELIAIDGDEEAIRDRFYRDLEFGTGGLRGVLGAGTNRINVCTVAKATQGFANDLLKHHKDPSVCISYDSRNNSKLFSETAASVFAANGIKVYLWSELMPTPALSFSVRYFKASGGVMVTASHNPAKYNGYKAYGSDGCQIAEELAGRVFDEIESLDIFNDIRIMDFESAKAAGMIEYIGEAVFDAFISAVSSQGVNLDSIDKDVAITYTPLHGAGRRCVTTVLARNGFDRVSVVASQAEPNGDFPTCPYPNPEIREALEEGLKAAAEQGSELLIATDPDCDRMGIAVKDGGEFKLLSGNQVGILLLDYICSQRIAKGTMPAFPVAVKTIVTSDMAIKVAQSYGVELREVLTGFKYIGEQIALLEEKGEESRYIFGFEESYGYLSGAYVRDKDAVDASLLTAEMFAYYKGKGLTLIEVMSSLYKKFGYFENALDNFAFEGAEGFNSMKRIMSSLRENIPQVPGKMLCSRTDFSTGFIYCDGAPDKPTGLPLSDVLRFSYEGDLNIVVRPSGTEPKLKIYYSVKAQDQIEAQALCETVRAQFQALIKDYSK